MKKPQQLSLAVVLALMLAPSALAGITDYPPAPQPPPPATATATGITDTPPGDVQSPVAPDSKVEVALILLQTVLSAF